MAGKTKEEPKQTLPGGHPQAGYVGPDHFVAGSHSSTSPEDQAWYDDQLAAHEAEVEAVAAHEHAVATAEGEARLATTTAAPASKQTSSSSKESS